MFLKSIRLENYRNHTLLNLEGFGKKNLIIGANASGKTNVMEAILRFNSYNKKKDSVIKLGEKRAIVNIEIIKGKTTVKHTLVIERTKERISLTRRQPLGRLEIIYFGPQDSNLFNNGPGGRRNFLDNACSLLKKRYQKTLSEYQKLIRHKNKILKNSNINKMLLQSINQQLIEKAEIIVKERVLFLKIIQPETQGFYRSLSNKNEGIKITYLTKTDLSNIYNSLYKQIKEKENLEITRGCSLAGPHRDDFCFNLEGLDVVRFGSQGEKRTACLSLKAAQIKVLKEAGLKPLLILDDALSELDKTRRNFLFKAIDRCEQVFITTTDDNVLFKEDIKRFKIGEK